MPDWADALRARLAGGPAAMVTVLAAEGSAPRGAGTRMVVGRDFLHGTIGGGRLEHVAIQQAQALLDHPAGSWRVQDYPLGPMLGQCCGGRVRLLVEHLDPQDGAWLELAAPGATVAHRFEETRIRRTPAEGPPSTPSTRSARPEPGSVLVERLDAPGRPLLLFGAGHVGRAIAMRCPGLPLRLGWFDTRPAMAEIDGVTVIDPAEIEACAEQAPADAAIFILTHDHGLDYRLTAAALRGPAAFVGLIGSQTKRARFLARLGRDGFSEADRARLTCPIGLPGITGKEPEVIAIAVIAQFLTLAPIKG